MALDRLTPLFLLLLLLGSSCKEQSNEKQQNTSPQAATSADSLSSAAAPGTPEQEAAPEKAVDTFKLTEDTAIDFFFEYQKDLEADKVRLRTSKGNFTIELFDDVAYHKANFIYLARKGYFDSTMFHRVVPDFIIQGGNADNRETAQKRSKIGRYLLPPDTRKGHRHHRGTVSMPSSEIDNPHMLASPYEFFIVVTRPGSYHLDGDYTAFGRVVEGMDVVDAINQVETDDGEWPMKNIYILEAEVLD